MTTMQKKTGQYYTKLEVVNAMVDMIEYRTDVKLYTKKILEPSAGDGAFLFVVISRLIESVRSALNFDELIEHDEVLIGLLKDCIRAIEVDTEVYNKLKVETVELLLSEGLNIVAANELAQSWIVNEDFLSWNVNTQEKFDYVIGNPPYIRVENMDSKTLAIYRERFSTMFDRADIYIAFIEHGLKMLSPEGILSYICTDRFTKNNYGKELRKFINKYFRVKYFIDIHKTQPFQQEVSSYPCIFGIDRQLGKDTICISSDVCSSDLMKKVVKDVVSGQVIETSNSYKIRSWFKKSEPWIMDFEIGPILQKLQLMYPSIKEAPNGVQCKVGVATGLNKVFLVSEETIEKYKLENDVLIPILTKNHLKSCEICWDGTHLINTFDENNQAINLDDFPNTKAYLELHKERLSNRAFVKKGKSGFNWYYTQEKVRLKEIKTPKIVFPDISLKSRMLIENGKYYPEGSLYYLLPGHWDILTLRIILESPIGLAFVKAYSTRMRGGYIRYQKQSVEKVCLPRDVDDQLEEELHRAWLNKDQQKLNLLIKKLYNLDCSEMNTLIKYTNS